MIRSKKLAKIILTLFIFSFVVLPVAQVEAQNVYSFQLPGDTASTQTTDTTTTIDQTTDTVTTDTTTTEDTSDKKGEDNKDKDEDKKVKEEEKEDKKEKKTSFKEVTKAEKDKIIEDRRKATIARKARYEAQRKAWQDVLQQRIDKQRELREAIARTREEIYKKRREIQRLNELRQAIIQGPSTTTPDQAIETPVTQAEETFEIPIEAPVPSASTAPSTSSVTVETKEHEDISVFSNRLKGDEFEEEEKIRVIIKYKNAPTTTKKDDIATVGGEVKREMKDTKAVAADLSQSELDNLLADGDIEQIDIDREVALLDTELDNSWGVNNIFSGSAHTEGLKGTGIKVAIFDTGIDYNHPDLKGSYAGGYDFVNDDADPMDDNGHGTHVAGIIAAADNNSGAVGVAPNVQIYALKVLDENGTGYASDLVAALEWAMANGIHITNLSFGTVLDPGSTVEQAFFDSNAAGILNIGAAGNSGTCDGGTNTVNYPGKYSSVLAVSATDKDQSRPCFSSTGAEVEVAAPGVDIYSTLRSGAYGTLNGTSMAAPHVSGVAALIYSNGIADGNADGKISDDIWLQITSTADDLGSAGIDTHFGYGIVNVESALAIESTVELDPALFATVSTDKNNYVVSSDRLVTISVQVTNEQLQSVSGLKDTAFTLRINGLDKSDATFTETGSSGTYTTTYTIANLSAGLHSISVSIKDLRDISGTGNGKFIIQASAGENISTQIALIDYTPFLDSEGRTNLDITTQITDQLGGAVEKATVVMNLAHESGQAWAGANLSDEEGKVRFSLKNVWLGCFSTTITSITKTGFAWDGTTPENKFCFTRAKKQTQPDPDAGLTEEQKDFRVFEKDRSTQLQKISNESQQLTETTIETLALRLGVARNSEREDIGNKLVGRVVSDDVSSIIKDQVFTFITYGTETSIPLGAGERAGVVNSFQEAYGYLPRLASDWEEVLKIANGRWPSKRSLSREVDAMERFERIYLRAADRDKSFDDAAVIIMAYGLRIGDRKFDSEKQAADIFEDIFDYAPNSATDWDMVRAIAYSGATR
ncbi:MAG: S8 family serine peptidase [Candidatus Jacksonbacteria bacterium]|jgi:subtilisin|nr:S8 family serine peptidase [Candidatus Jacksonbacteria bacterium]MBT6034588.1 S8 family serine peptidase [Candidatus Jacksonbacteria bacterium]